MFHTQMTIFLKSKHKDDMSDMWTLPILNKSWHLRWGGGGYSTVVKLRIGILDKMSKSFAIPNSGIPSMAHSLSYTTCVGANKPNLGIQFVANVARMKSVMQ